MKKSQMSLLSHQFVSPKKTFEIEDVLGFSTENQKEQRIQILYGQARKTKIQKLFSNLLCWKISLIAGPLESKWKQWKELCTKQKVNALGNV